jgi:hypothetical protein
MFSVEIPMQKMKIRHCFFSGAKIRKKSAAIVVQIGEKQARSLLFGTAGRCLAAQGYKKVFFQEFHSLLPTDSSRFRLESGLTRERIAVSGINNDDLEGL